MPSGRIPSALPEAETSVEGPSKPYLTRPPALRLRRSAEFQHVREHGKTAIGRYLRISAAPADRINPINPIPSPKLTGIIDTAGLELEESRVGIITTRRIGGAVLRVRVRRLLRELHRLHRPGLRPGLWIVLIGKREAATAPWSALCREWLHLGQKLSIFVRA